MKYAIGCLMLFSWVACDQASPQELDAVEQAATCSPAGLESFLSYGEVKTYAEANQCGAKEEVSPYACDVANAATDAFFDPSCDAHDGDGACDFAQKPKVISLGCSSKILTDCRSRWDDGSCLRMECQTCCYWFPEVGLRCFQTCTQPRPE